MNWKQILILIVTMILALGLRLYYIPAHGYEQDMHSFKTWSQTATQNGVVNIYDKIPCDYPPGYLYVLKTVGSLYHIFSPSFVEHTYLFDFLIKLPAILADLAIALIIFFFLLETFSYRVSLLATMAYAFNPIIFFDSAYWGQIDSIPTLVGLLAILALIREKYGWAWGLMTIAILIKTQFVILLPILILVTWRDKGFKTVLNGFCVSWFTWLAVLLPFFYYHKIDQVLDRIFKTVGEYPYLSLYAFNLWWLLSNGLGRAIPDNVIFMNLFTYRTMGTILLGIFFVLLLRYLFYKGKDDQALFLSCALAFLGFFMLPTEMHERYIFPVFVFMLLAAMKRMDLKIIYGLLSLTAFLNLFMALGWTYPKNVPSVNSLLSVGRADVFASIINVAVLFYFLCIILKGINIKYVLSMLLLLLAIFTGLYFARLDRPVYLSDREPQYVHQQWGTLRRNRSVDGNQLSVNGFIYAKGLGTHAYSSIKYQLDGHYRFLEGAVGLDSEQNRGNKIEFFIYADKRQIFRSGILQGWIKPRYFYLPIAGVKEIDLVVGDGGDGINCDHADWLGIKIIP